MLRIMCRLVLCGSFHATAQEFVRADQDAFIDAQGRQLLLHGVSVINKSCTQGYRNWETLEDYQEMRSWGMNCVRLGMLWDGLEPEPGAYDEAYLAHIDESIAWAKEAGLYVFLDMHQDLYSPQYSDGAPDWATLTNGQPHVTGGTVWSDAYILSPAIQRAFDNFWANAPCADGMGVQDHFAKTWRFIAQRYAKEPTVIGFDLFNEPNIGSGNVPAMEAMVAAFLKAIAEKDGTLLSPEDASALWFTHEGRLQLMTYLNDIDFYTRMVDAAAPIYQAFERDKVTALFQRVRNAIREVSTQQIIFLETSMSANMGVPCGIEAVCDAKGRQDPLQAFAPHAYDIVVDTPLMAQSNTDRLDLIFERHQKTQQRLAMPMLLGEWGALGGSGADILPFARHHLRILEKMRCSETYWANGRNLDERAYFEILCRPYPARVNGTLLAYETDFENKTFRCEWREDRDAQGPTRIFLPQAFALPESIQLDASGEGFSLEAASAENTHQWLIIPPIAKKASRILGIGIPK
jgi:endoglycosylceramidase